MAISFLSSVLSSAKTRYPFLGSPFLCVKYLNCLLREGEGDDIGARGYGDVLLVIEGVGHRRGVRRLVRLKCVQQFSCARVGGGKDSVIGAEEDHATCSREHASPTGAVPRLRYLPDRFAGVDVDGSQDALSRVRWVTTEGAGHVAVA